jgi:hypothetical protein
MESTDPDDVLSMYGTLEAQLNSLPDLEAHVEDKLNGLWGLAILKRPRGY